MRVSFLFLYFASHTLSACIELSLAALAAQRRPGMNIMLNLEARQGGRFEEICPCYENASFGRTAIPRPHYDACRGSIATWLVRDDALREVIVMAMAMLCVLCFLCYLCASRLVHR